MIAAFTVHIAARHATVFAEVPLIAFFRGMHLPIALARLVLGGRQGGDHVAIVPPRSNALRASRCSATASNTVFVSSCASSAAAAVDAQHYSH